MPRTCHFCRSSSYILAHHALFDLDLDPAFLSARLGSREGYEGQAVEGVLGGRPRRLLHPHRQAGPAGGHGGAGGGKSWSQMAKAGKSAS